MILAIRITLFFLTTQHFAFSQNAWSSWSSWSACSHEDTQHTRFRTCLDARDGKTLNPEQCPGLSKRTRQCKRCSYSLVNHRDIRYSGVHTTKTSALCVSQVSDKNKYVEIFVEMAMKNFVQLTRVETRGHGNGYVKNFRIKYSYNGDVWFYLNEFPGNMDALHVQNNTLDSRIVLRRIRIYPTGYSAQACFSVQLYGCPYNCGGMIAQDASLITPPIPRQNIEELNCLWRIESKHARKLQLKFSHFKLLCKNGLLELYSGKLNPTSEENLEEAFCGHSSGVSTHILEGGTMWMHYHSNATTSDIEFKIHVNAFAVRTLNATSEQIVQPKIGYSNIYRYGWIITAPKKNDTIELSLDYFLSNNTKIFRTKCVADVIIIHYGNEEGTLVEKYCKNESRVITSTNGFLKIKYKSKTNNPKWRMKFSYKILGYPYPSPTTTNLQQTNVNRNFTKRSEPGTIQSPSRNANDTNFVAAQEKPQEESSKMLKSNSAVSVGIPGNDEPGTLKVSDNFTEECMKLLNNNLSSTSDDGEDAGEDFSEERFEKVGRYGSLPEADRTTQDIEKSSLEDSLPEAEIQSPETDTLLNKRSSLQ
ncbi:uncharacterized protein LOC114527504 isoform X2 [Dendronephthya gigantea]|uniref:uncharacterized protein LOC114527504 isoform X2 n=1 Tax=Dendronephthya gigantea TaxID=151771 RepID=UPI00106AFC1B|nr:uncharacterized protein LOC114527504 isoform X2 [Dendronephthya gigantea]